MKKIIMAVLGILMFSPVVFADNWGLGLKLGGGVNDPKDLKDMYHAGLASSNELDKSGAVFGLEALYEWNLDETNKIGVKIGWDFYGENELKLKGISGIAGANNKITEETYAFPLTVYYKRDNGVKKLSWFAGAGVTLIRTKLESSGIIDDDTHKSKVFPHIVAGGEYRFSELFALGLEARYNIGAKVKKHGDIYSDRSGFGAALTGRFYF